MSGGIGEREQSKGISRNRFLDFLTLAVLAAALGTAAASWLPNREMPGAVEGERVSNAQWDYLVTSPMHAGSTAARVTVVEFTDYECSACRAAEATLRRYRAQFGADLRVVYRSWPLEQHRLARRAARLAVCAARAGVFEEVHGDLFSSVDWMEYPDEGLRKIGGSHVAPVDTGSLWACERSDEVRGIVDADVALARELGGKGTPFFVINGARYQQLPDSGAMAALIRRGPPAQR